MISRTLQKVRMRGGKGKDWKLICLPMESFPSFSTITFCLKIITSYHDYVSLRRILPQYCIQNGKRNCQYTMSLLELPAWPAMCNKQKKLGLRMYQTSRASSNKSVRAQLVSLFLSPLPFPFSSYSTSPLHLPF